MRDFFRTFQDKLSVQYYRDSYGQVGEDLIMERLFDDQETGFYVDVGAHHPKRYSNTYRFYRRGWRGINIDANPGSMAAFRQMRPRDINVEAGVAGERGEMVFYVFSDPAYNTFDRELAMQRVGKSSITQEVRVSIAPLSALLDQYMPKGVTIDMMTIDVEGFDFQVLQSNDWARYSPRYVLAECLNCETLEGVVSDPVTKYLAERRYTAIAKTISTVIFRHDAAS